MLNLNIELINCTVSFHSVRILNFAISNREMFIFLKSCTLHHFKKILTKCRKKKKIQVTSLYDGCNTLSYVNFEFTEDTAK